MNLSKSRSEREFVSLDEESEHDPNYKILKKNVSANSDADNDKGLAKSGEKDFVPNNKFVDPELWRSLLPYANGKRIISFVERMKKNLPENEANYLIEKLMKSD